MTISNEFKDAVEQGKITRVKIMLKDSLLLDPSSKTFDELLNYAKSNMGSLIDIHNGETFKSSEKWDEDYLNEEMVAVVSNFSIERIELLKEIVKKLYYKEEKIEEINSKTASETMNGMKIAGGAVAVAGIGLLVGGLVIKDAPIVVPVLGGVVIGVGVFLLLKK